jgi:predicted regulator of Ras-like GTPase activity (Roadblock/LC7/MglB family)
VVHVDADEALDELSRLSTEIRSAAIVDASGSVMATTRGGDGERLARTASELLDVAAAVDPARAVDRVEVRLGGGTVFVVRAGHHTAVATTPPETPGALVVHDLRTCLAGIDA